MFKSITSLTSLRTPLISKVITRQKKDLLYFKPASPFLNFFNKNNSRKKKINRVNLIKSQSLLENIVRPFSKSFQKNFKYEQPQQKEKSYTVTELDPRAETAYTLFCLGQYDEALMMFREIYNKAKQECDEYDPILAHYLKRIGDVYFEIKDFDFAINYYDQSLEILVNSLGEKNGKVARNYYLLGTCYIKQRNYIEAIENLENSLETYLKLGGRYNNEIASCYSMLVHCYQPYGKYEEVRDYTEKLLAILRKVHKVDVEQELNDQFMTQYYLNLGVALAETTQNNYRQALEYLMHYRNSQIDINGIQGLRVAESHIGIGKILSMQGNYNAAMNFLNKALKSLEYNQYIFGSKSKLFGSCYNEMGIVYLRQKKFSQALEMFEKALENMKETSLEKCICLRNMGVIFERQQQIDKALEYFQESIGERSKIFQLFPKVDIEEGVLHACMATLLFNKQDYEKGNEHFINFLEIALRFCGEEAEKLKKI